MGISFAEKARKLTEKALKEKERKFNKMIVKEEKRLKKKIYHATRNAEYSIDEHYPIDPTVTSVLKDYFIKLGFSVTLEDIPYSPTSQTKLIVSWIDKM